MKKQETKGIRKNNDRNIFKSLQLAVVAIGTSTAAVSFAGQALAAESPMFMSQTAASSVSAVEAIPQDANHLRKIVTMNVRLGGNPCSARGMKPFIEARREGRTLNLYPRVIRSVADMPAFCTTEWRPVYLNYQFEVATRVGNYDAILVHDIESTDGTLTTVSLN